MYTSLGCFVELMTFWGVIADDALCVLSVATCRAALQLLFPGNSLLLISRMSVTATTANTTDMKGLWPRFASLNWCKWPLTFSASTGTFSSLFSSRNHTLHIFVCDYSIERHHSYKAETELCPEVSVQISCEIAPASNLVALVHNNALLSRLFRFYLPRFAFQLLCFPERILCHS